MVAQHETKPKRPRRFLTLQRQLQISLIGVNMFVTLFIGLAFYWEQRRSLLSGIDAKLESVASIAKEMLPPDYHARITGPDSVTDEDFQKIVDRNNRLCVRLGIEYIWSLMLVDGKVLFTTATSPDKIAENRTHAKFYEPHSNPELYTNTFTAMHTTFQSSHDKWGELRVALVPSTDGKGRSYLFGACVRLTEVERQLRSIVWQALAIGFYVFIFSLAVSIWLAQRATMPIQKLTDTIRAVASGKSNQEAEESGSLEQVTLARCFNQMNRALQGKLIDSEATRLLMIGLHTEELKNVEESLMMSEQRYRGLLDFAVDGILVGSHEGVIIEANRCMCDLFGLSRDELIGKHIRDMPFSAESLRDNPFRFDRVQRGETVVTERTIRRKDGSEVIVEMHSKMMPDATYQSIYHDITVRKRGEEALKEIRRLLDETQSFAHLGGWEVDFSTKKVVWTEEVYRIYGVGRDFDVNDSSLAFSYFAPEHAPAIMKALTEGLARGESADVESEFIRANGERIWVRVMGQPVLENGVLVRAHGCIMDITQRKRAEEALKETRQMLDDAQRMAKLGAWKYEVATGRIFWSDEVYRIHGVGRDFDLNDLEGALAFYAPESARLLRDALTRAVEQAEPYDLELEFIRANGEHIWVRSAACATLEAGQVVFVSGSFMDISERKLAEAEIRQAQERLSRQYEMLEALLQNLTVGVFMVEAPSGKPLVANPAARQLLGKGILIDADAQNLGQVYEAYKLSDRTTRYPVNEMPITLGMQGISSHVDDLVVMRPDGSNVMLEIFGTPVKDKQGHVWASLVSFADITERKRIEMALRDSENRYRQLFEMESDAIFLIDNETGRILDVNWAAQTLYGYSRDELLSLRNVDVSAEEDATQQATQQARASQPAFLRIALRKHRKRDGTVFPVEITASCFSINERSVHIAAIRDISERERAEGALRDSETRYRQLFEMESDALFLIDIEAQQILDVNLAAQELYGYSRAEILAGGFMAFSDEPETTKSIIQTCLDTGTHFLSVPRIRHRKKDGSTLPVEIKGRFFTLDGRLVLNAAVRDITDRANAQQLLESWNASLEQRVVERTAEVQKYSQQLQALTERLVRFEETERKRIADVLHEDLQQALVASRMTLSAALGSVKGGKAQGLLNAVDGMLEHALRLTRSLVHEIAVPSVREGELPFAFGWLAQQMQEKFGMQVNVTAEEALPPVGENVYLCLYRAVQELLFNVVKHAKVLQAEIAMRRTDGDSIEIVVSDQGCGFSPALNVALESNADGFGLFSVRERIEGLGGRMKIISEIGRGTSISLTAPISG